MGEQTFRTVPSYHPGRPVGTRPTVRRSATLVQRPLVAAGPPPVPDADGSARPPTGRRALPTPTNPAAPISEPSPAGPPVAPRINAVTITLLEGPAGLGSEIGAA